MLNTVRVPSDPAQVIVNHASFRVRLGDIAGPRRHAGGGGVAAPVLPTSVRSAAEARTGRRRAAPLVWSGHTDPGDPAAAQLLQAVRGASATRLLPRVAEPLPRGETDEGMPAVRPAVIAPRSPLVGPPPAGGGRTVPRPGRAPHGDRPSRAGRADRAAEDTYDIALDPELTADPYGDGSGRYRDETDRARRERRRGEPVRHAWYPGRRMNLGVVLLPLRVFLGLICVYAGLGKLCDPVYFDGGARGSMVHWLGSLHPWSAAEPLRSAALSHPVGAGLTVAFLQVVVGVLTVMGLWQRIAAAFGALLSAALLVTVSWRTVPVYDAPDIVYLAAWSPLVIAGAPVYSIDSRLAGEAWRRLGPRAPLWQLRRFVVRRGVVLATLVAGGALVVGALFGSAVRASSSHVRTPSLPSGLPTNDLPGSPGPVSPGAVPPGGHGQRRGGRGSASPSPDASSSARPHGSAPPRTGATAGTRPVGRQPVHTPRQPAVPLHTVPADPASPSGGASGGSGGSGDSGGSLGGLLGIRPTSGYLLGMPGGHQGTGTRPGVA